MRANLVLFALSLLACSGGCAHRRERLTAPDAPLGRVIVYRSGVAYFERRATVQDEITLQVPADRVDDFLKSLTITDTASGRALPLSYPTRRRGPDNRVAMTIALPAGKHDVRIAYVTESPAWKPSYRVMLGASDDAAARLQGWAIVDNTSGEPWRRVVVGVGSTSALSFRYDLHSVRLVERESIVDGTRVAAAPPTGGSAYAVDGADVRVLADLSGDVVAQLGPRRRPNPRGVRVSRSRQLNMEEFRGIPLGGSDHDFAEVVATGGAVTRSPVRDATTVESDATTALTEPADAAAPDPAESLAQLVAQVRGSHGRVRIEGWSTAGEPTGPESGLARANALRDRLVEEGVPADRLEVVGNAGLAPDGQLLRVTALEHEVAPQTQRDELGAQAPRDAAQFLSRTPMTIEAGHSAMVTLFDEDTRAQRVYLFDPVSARGSQRFAFNAVRIVNPTDDMLDEGPITVYAGEQFLGEGLAEPIAPRATALVPYGLDRTIVIETEAQTREEIEQLRKLERGIATSASRRIARVRYSLVNRGHADATIYVRHRVPEGWSLRDPPPGLEHLGGDVLVPVSLAAGASTTLTLEDTTPSTTAIDLRSPGNMPEIELWLRQHEVAPPLREQLDRLLAAHRELVDLDQIIHSRRGAAQQLRERIDELREQLVALRQVSRAQSLSGHLARRMRSLGDSLDRVSDEIGKLEGDRLQRGIELEDLVAELRLGPAATAAR